jgi:hypothetical protein
VKKKAAKKVVKKANAKNAKGTKKSIAYAGSTLVVPCDCDGRQHIPRLDLPDALQLVDITRLPTRAGTNTIAFEVKIKQGVTQIDLRYFGFQVYRVDPFGTIDHFRIRFTPVNGSLTTGRLECTPEVIPPEGDLAVRDDGEIVITVITKKTV